MVCVKDSVLVLLLRSEKDLAENKSKGSFLLPLTLQLNLRSKISLLSILHQKDSISHLLVLMKSLSRSHCFIRKLIWVKKDC